MRAIILQTQSPEEKDEEEVLRALKQRFSCSLWCRSWWDRPWSAAHGGLWWSRDPPAVPMLQQMDDPDRRLWLCENHMLEEAPGKTCGTVEERSLCWSRFAGRTCEPMGYLWWGSSWRFASRGKDLMLEGKCVKSHCQVEGGVIETVCDELMQPSFLISLHYCREGGRGNYEVEKGLLRFGFISLYSVLIWLIKN